MMKACAKIACVLMLWGMGAVMMLGCEGSSKVKVLASYHLLAADGETTASLEVTVYGDDGEPLSKPQGVQLLLDGEPFEGTTFKTRSPGEYRFTARYQGHTSAAYTIQALSAKRFVYEVMKHLYLWQEHLPTVDPTKASSEKALLESLLHSPSRGGQDIWTHIVPRKEEDDFDKGKYVGYGFRVGYDGKKALRIRFAHEDSPCVKAGLRRPFRILELGGKTIQQIEDGDLWASILEVGKAGHELPVKYEDDKGQVKDAVMVKGEVGIVSVARKKILDVKGVKVGYFLFSNFIDTSIQELDATFASFKQAKVQELIVDLRINGGGSLLTAQHLGSLIAGKRGEGKIFSRFVYHPNTGFRSRTRPFLKLEQALDLKRVYVLTSTTTASASEMLINGLRSVMEVVQVGTRTFGKPVGFRSLLFFDKYLSVIAYYVSNHENKGRFFNGLKPKIAATDDLSHDFGDPQESLLKAALGALQGQKAQPLTAALPPDPPLRGIARRIGTY